MRVVDTDAADPEPVSLVFQDVTDFCRLFLFRHPELAEAHQNRAIGGGPADLSRRGRSQVLHWLKLLESTAVDGVHCPDQPQCLDPARAVAQQKGLEVRPESRLRDQDLGRWQGHAWEELAKSEGDAVREFFAEFGEAVPPGGESLGQAVERMLHWWTDVAAQSLGKTLVLVLPGAMISGFTAAMLGMRLSRCISLNLPHGGHGVLDVFGNGVRIATWNPEGLT